MCSETDSEPTALSKQPKWLESQIPSTPAHAKTAAALTRGSASVAVWKFVQNRKCTRHEALTRKAS